MKKEFDNNETIKYATKNIAAGLTDLKITIIRDSDDVIIVNEVVMTEYSDCFYKYELGNLAIDNYSGTISSVSESLETDFGLEIVLSESGLTDAEHNALMDTAFQERCIFIDTELLVDGDGTSAAPFNSFTNALDFAEAEGIRCIKLFSDATVDRNLKNFVVHGVGTPALDCNGQNLDKSEFNRLVMKGIYTGQIVVQESILFDGFRINGFFETCGLAGDLVLSGDALIANCFAHIPGTLIPTLNVNGYKVSVRNYNGGLGINNCSSVDSEITIALNAGKVILDNTNTAGLIGITGVGLLTDNSNGSTVDATGLVQATIIASIKLIADKIYKYVKLIFFTK